MKFVTRTLGRKPYRAHKGKSFMRLTRILRVYEASDVFARECMKHVMQAFKLLACTLGINMLYWGFTAQVQKIF